MIDEKLAQKVEELKEFISNYTTYTLEYVDDNYGVYFSYNLVEFCIRIKLNDGDSTQAENIIYVVSKKQYDTEGEYEERYESSDLNAVLNVIDYLLFLNTTSS